jgi:hypothetical protein
MSKEERVIHVYSCRKVLFGSINGNDACIHIVDHSRGDWGVGIEFRPANHVQLFLMLTN